MKDYDYSKLAKYYDILEVNEEVLKFNKILDKLLNKFNIETVLDISCGTGSQAIPLAKIGYKVTASDLNKEMLNVAKEKAKGLRIDFKQGDMTKINIGKFDAVISIFNAIGHLNKSDFEKAVKNIRENLNHNGIFIFDIFNLDFMRKNFKKGEFIDKSVEHEGTKFVRFNKNTLDLNKGIMHVNQRISIQESDRSKELKESWDMQIYTSDQLKEILERNGFEVLEFLSMDGTKFDKDNSLFILTIARKKWNSHTKQLKK